MSIGKYLVVIAASTSVGAVLGATFAPQHEGGEAQLSSAPALETFYVPAQVVNRATKIEDQPDAF